VHQVGEQTRLYYDARSTNYQVAVISALWIWCTVTEPHFKQHLNKHRRSNKLTNNPKLRLIITYYDVPMPCY